MFRKVNNKLLGFLFALLLLVVVVVFLFEGGKNERTFREVLVDFDTSAVTEILIYPKSKNHREVKLFKEANEWKVALQNGKTAGITSQRVTDVFTQLLAIKPKRLAARSEDKWNEFQVDTTGSRVKIMEGSENTLHLVIGRFSFQQPRTMNSFVRLYNDVDVYEVDGFLDMIFNQDESAFRDGSILNDDFNSWQQLQFDYPADSSFILIKKANKWFVNSYEADSSKVINYLRGLSRLTNTSFLDDVSTNLSSPTFTLNITDADLNFSTIKGFVTPTGYFVHSSENPETYFDGNSVGKTIFVSISNFK